MLNKKVYETLTIKYKYWCDFIIVWLYICTYLKIYTNVILMEYTVKRPREGSPCMGNP